MGGVDKVVREWLCHVLIHCLMLGLNDWIVFASKKTEMRERDHDMHLKLLSDFYTLQIHHKRAVFGLQHSELTCFLQYTFCKHGGRNRGSALDFVKQCLNISVAPTAHNKN